MSGKTKPAASSAYLRARNGGHGAEDGSDEGHFEHRRLCQRMDKPRANTATAHKLARMAYFMVTRGEEFVDQGLQRYEAQQRERSIAALKR